MKNLLLIFCATLLLQCSAEIEPKLTEEELIDRGLIEDSSAGSSAGSSEDSSSDSGEGPNAGSSVSSSAGSSTGSSAGSNAESSSSEAEYGEPCGGWCKWNADTSREECSELRSDPEGKWGTGTTCALQIGYCGSNRYNDANCTVKYSSSAVVVSSSSRAASSSSAVVGNSSQSGGGNGTAGPVPYYGKLKANGNKIVGSKTGSSTPVQVRGVSLYWSNTGWGGDRFFTSTAINAMVDDWKAEVIRVPIGYSENGGYQTDPSNLTRVKTAINAAIAKDVYVIIDWHSHNADNELEAATAFFTEMAQTYGKKDHVIFELYNEPKEITWSTIKTYATSIISTIRQYSDNLVLVGTPNWDQKVNAVVGNTLTDNNVAYVFHFYAYSHTLSSFQSAINAVLDANKPVFVSEYGTTHYDGGNYAEGNFDTHSTANTDAWHTYMDGKKISSCAWSLTDNHEGSAFFGTGTTFDMTSWTNTSKMTASGQYIYNKLRTYANSAPWRSGSSGGEEEYGTPCGGYCQWEDGCFELRSDPEGRYSYRGDPMTCSEQIDNCVLYSEPRMRFRDANCTTPY